MNEYIMVQYRYKLSDKVCILICVWPWVQPLKTKTKMHK